MWPFFFKADGFVFWEVLLYLFSSLITSELWIKFWVKPSLELSRFHSQLPAGADAGVQAWLYVFNTWHQEASLFFLAMLVKLRRLRSVPWASHHSQVLLWAWFFKLLYFFASLVSQWFSLILMMASSSPGLPRWLGDKESACQCRRHRRLKFNPWIGKMPWRRKQQPTCLENPMDGGACWATAHEVAESVMTEHTHRHLESIWNNRLHYKPLKP